MKFLQLVVGPAGCGKSTYCQILQEHCENNKRRCHVINLDPAAETFRYQCSLDIRDLICVDDCMEELDLGPNGGLVYALEHLVENIEWLEDKFEEFPEDDYILLDCPGQVELYTHMPVMRQLVDAIRSWDCAIAGVYCLDTTFISDTAKFISGALTALSTMIQLELPHINVLTKSDLVADYSDITRILDSEPADLADDLSQVSMPPKYKHLNMALTGLLEEFNLVTFVPLNPNDEDSIDLVLRAVDNSIQYGENQEPRADFDLSTVPDREEDAPDDL